MPTAIVVGSGVAGLVTALKLAGTHEVTIVTKDELAESNTRYAQGGIAAVLSDDDSVEAHILDTVRAGAGLSRYEAVEALCVEGPARIADLIDFGVRFDRDGGDLARGLEAAHSHPRILHAGGDATGAAIERALVGAIRESAVRIVENAFLADLIATDGAVVGVDLILPTGALSLYADAVVIATGGAGRLYRHTTNPVVTTGDGVAAAWRAGAALTDAEFYQFHPTALAVAGNFLVSEAVRGEGAVLINDSGERFMLDVHPDAELAPRDVVARGIAVEMSAQGGNPVRLDASALGGEFLARRFPTIDAAVRASGFDWSREPVPVTPAAHYWMGGIETDIRGRTSLTGLFAVGEAACTGVHGANRLASNSLLEAVVFADRAATTIARERVAVRRRSDRSGDAGNAVASPRQTGLPVAATDPSLVDRAALQDLMWQAAGVQRSGDSLQHAAESLERLRCADPATATIAQREDANLLDLSRVLVRAAIARRESRGAHYRSDHPTDSADFAHHLRWAREGVSSC